MVPPSFFKNYRSELSSASLRNPAARGAIKGNDGIVEYWKVVVLRSALKLWCELLCIHGIIGIQESEIVKVLNNPEYFHYSIIPTFHYSAYEVKKMLSVNPLLSTICRISETLN